MGETCVYSLILHAKGVRQPTNIFAEIGTEIHKFLEEYVKMFLGQKMQTETIKQLPTIKNHPTIENFVKLELDRIENVGSVYEDVEHYIEVTINLEDLIEMDGEWEKVAQQIQQLTHFQFSKLTLKGFIDRVDDLNGDKILIDYKTGSLEYVDMDEMWFYALLWWLKYGQIPKFVVLYGLKEGKMKWDVIDESRLKQYYKQVLIRIKNIIISILKFLESGELKKNCKKCWWKEVCDLRE